MSRALPKWDLLKRHFPAFAAADVARIIGGKVQYNHDIGVFTNFCCIRVSRALNKSGHPVAYFKDVGARGGGMKPAVSSGKNHQWHIFRVRSLRKYMEKIYGAGEPFTSANYATGMNGRNGIVLYEVPGWNDASGHADCWEETKCLFKDYGDKAQEIYFWEAT